MSDSSTPCTGLSASRVPTPMPSTKTLLLAVSRVTDCNTGIYEIGELDFSVPMDTDDWLKHGDNRERLTKWLRWLADSCEHQRPPFGSNFPPSTGADGERG